MAPTYRGNFITLVAANDEHADPLHVRAILLYRDSTAGAAAFTLESDGIVIYDRDTFAVDTSEWLDFGGPHGQYFDKGLKVTAIPAGGKVVIFIATP